MGSPFTFPPLPTPTYPTFTGSSGSDGMSTSSSVGNCPAGQHWDQNLRACVGNMPGGSPSPTPPYPHAPGPTPTPTTPSGGAGPCPPGTPGGPAACCPPGTVYRTDTQACEAPDARQKAGQDTCGGPLPQCPPGQDVWCDFDDQTFKCAKSQFTNEELCGRQNRIRRDQGKPPLPCDQFDFGQGGGGSGGGGGGGGAARRPAGPSSASMDFDAMLRQNIERDINAPSRFTPEALQAMYGEITRQSAGAIRRGSRAVQQNAAQRNMQRAGSTGAALRDVRDTAEQQRGQAGVNVQMAKIQTDHQDKTAALDRAQRYLDSLRDNEYRYALMGEQRRQFDSNLALAYANLAQQRSMLQMQLQSSWDMLRANQGFWLLTQSA